MQRHIVRPILVLALAALAAAPACRREETPTTQTPAPSAVGTAPAFRVAVIELGSSLGADRRVSAPTTTFAPTDTIYASVATDGAAPGVTLSAR